MTKILNSMKIDPLVKKTIQKIAKRKGISMSALIHDALDSYILNDRGRQAFDRHEAKMEANRKEGEIDESKR